MYLSYSFGPGGLCAPSVLADGSCILLSDQAHILTIVITDFRSSSFSLSPLRLLLLTSGKVPRLKEKKLIFECFFYFFGQRSVMEA